MAGPRRPPAPARPTPCGLRPGAGFPREPGILQQYTRPIPEGAQRVTVKGKPAVRFKDAEGRNVTAPLTRKGDRCRVASPVWYGEYTDADGARQRVPSARTRPRPN